MTYDLLLDDIPPSYDDVTDSVSVSVAGSSSQAAPDYHPSQATASSSSAAATAAEAPAYISEVFYKPPPNAEPKISQEAIEAGPNKVEMHRVGDHDESWDPKLSDPAQLYDWIRAQALVPPSGVLHCVATHTEVSNTSQQVLEGGIRRQLKAGDSYQVTDFDFTIDLQGVWAHANTANIALAARRAHIPTYRGHHRQSIGGPEHQVFATGWAVIQDDGRADYNYRNGLAPWSDMAGDAPPVRPEDEEALLSGDASLLSWCEAYCADRGFLKSFELTKVVWGWKIDRLRGAVERAIASAGYQLNGGTLRVDFEFTDTKVVVRPDNRLVRWLYTPIIFFFLCITLIYPMIWLWQRCHHRGGGPYTVAVATYGCKLYVPLPSTFPQETVEVARTRMPATFKLHPEVPRDPVLVRGPKGVHYLLGRREGEWFREWEERIRFAVRMGYHGELPQSSPDGNAQAVDLDGY